MRFFQEWYWEKVRVCLFRQMIRYAEPLKMHLIGSVRKYFRMDFVEQTILHTALLF